MGFRRYFVKCRTSFILGSDKRVEFGRVDGMGIAL